jgi:hypothetical protein
MAKVITGEVQIKTGAATKDVDNLRQGVENFNAEVVDANKKAIKGFKGLEKAVDKTSRGFKGLGIALKAAGIGLVAAAFAKLVEVFKENQLVVNGFNTAFEAVSLAFNDFFNFLNRNVGTVIDYFKGLFQDPVTALKNFGTAIVNNVIERVSSALDALGFLGDAVIKVFKGDFAGAAEAAKNAGKELVDVVTGVDDSFDKIAEAGPAVVKSITNYAKSTLDAAKSTVELNRAAEVGIAQNRIILEQKDREAEQLRQIRDDETLTIAERIAANEKLGEVLNEQERLMLANAQAVIDAAQAQFDKNANDENQIALLDARAEKEGILAQIEGFRSEQIINRISLEREADEKKIEDQEKLIELEEQRREGIFRGLDAVAKVAGEESKIAKALFLMKQGMILKEQITQASATIARITAAAAESGVDGAKGFMKAAAAAPPPANVPLIAIFAAQAAGIAATIAAAVNSAKSKIGSIGGGGGGTTSAPTPPPAFNVVGAAPENQLAETISQQQDRPIKAFVTSTDVSSQQALDRSIEDEAAI